MGTDFATRSFICPYCGHDIFKEYAQTIEVGGRTQVYEYTCTRCKRATAIRTVR